MLEKRKVKETENDLKKVEPQIGETYLMEKNGVTFNKKIKR